MMENPENQVCKSDQISGLSFQFAVVVYCYKTYWQMLHEVQQGLCKK